MEITRYELFDEEELLSSIRKVKLRGFNSAQVYSNAKIELKRSVSPIDLCPAQNYVLEDNINRIEAIYNEFLSKSSVDIFALNGGLRFWIRDEHGIEDGPIPLIPPVVELSLEPGSTSRIQLINDGMHRVYTAKKLNKKINIILVSNIPKEYPYYAFALDNGWLDVAEIKELSDGHVKKNYRYPNNYKSLFRDFNAVFPSIQKQRKKSNPGSFNQ